MAEITTTQSFSDGDTVTATKLNNIQANASVQPDAITNRTAETTIDQANDLLLIYDASATALKKVSASNLIKAGTASDFPITGNATIGGTLGVTGNSTLSGTLGVTGAITATSTINGTTIPTTKTLVTTVDTQTLTNKTLTSPIISTSAISGGTLDNATIGATTPSTGSFTSLSATSLSVTNTITGSISGNAGTATNGVVTTGTFADPTWITSLAKSKVGLGSVPNTDCTNASNISSGTLGLARLGTLSTGQVLAGNAGTATATTLSGDATIGATGTITLANSGATSGTYGSSSLIPAITIDAKGRITSASNTSFTTTPADGSITFAKLSTSSTESDNAAKRVAKTWVNFNGQGTISIRDDFNVSTITDNAIGNYTVNFTSALSSASYCAVFAVQGPADDLYSAQINSATSPTTSSISLRTGLRGVAFDDLPIVNVCIFL